MRYEVEQQPAPSGPALRAIPVEPAQSPGLRRELIRRRYSERRDLPGTDPTRFGDWEYGGRCTDF